MMKASLLVFLSIALGSATSVLAITREPPANSKEVYRTELGWVTHRVIVNRNGDLCVPLMRLRHKTDERTRHDNRIVCCSRDGSISTFTTRESFSEDGIVFTNWGMAMDVIPADGGIYSMKIGGQPELLYRGSVGKVYLNDDGLLVFKTWTDTPQRMYTYHIRWPGQWIKHFDEPDPKLKGVEFLIDPRGNVAEASQFENKSGPLQLLRKNVRDLKRYQVWPVPMVPDVAPFLEVAGVNEHFGFVYSTRDPKEFKIFLYSKARDSTRKIYESEAFSRFVIDEHRTDSAVQVLQLADNGDMLLHITAPPFKTFAGDTKLFVYRYLDDKLYEPSHYVPANDTGGGAIMNHRGEMLLYTTDIKTTRLNRYLLPASGEAPRLIPALSGIRSEYGINDGLFVTDQGKPGITTTLNDWEGPGVVALVSFPPWKWWIFIVPALIIAIAEFVSFRIYTFNVARMKMASATSTAAKEPENGTSP